MDSSSKTIRDFSALTPTGEEVRLGKYYGEVILIVNTATKCGLSTQFPALQQIYSRYKDSGFTILGFPCNQFGEQEPDDDLQILQTCRDELNLTFPIFAKVDVNGPNAHPLFQWLTQETKGILGSSIKWNFAKFLVDRNGRVVRRFAPSSKPEHLVPDIERLIAMSRY